MYFKGSFTLVRSGLAKGVGNICKGHFSGFSWLMEENLEEASRIPLAFPGFILLPCALRTHGFLQDTLGRGSWLVMASLMEERCFVLKKNPFPFHKWLRIK